MRYPSRFSIWIATFAGLIGAWLPASVSAHGGVVLEDDVCVINVGFYQAHFTIFQPRSRGHEQFCEDVPDAGETVFVLEYLHDGLAQLPLDFRVVRNTTGMGRFAGVDDVRKVPDLDAVTVFFRPAATTPDVLTVLHDFAETGEFIGIVSANAADSDAVYTAVFPFEVGYAGPSYTAIAFSLVFAALGLYMLTVRRRRAGAVVALLLASTTAAAATGDERHESDHGLFSVTCTSELEPIPINRMHRWHVAIVDARGAPVLGAEVTVTGGMPLHDHGLPSAPRMTRELGGGVYLIEGMKFHMPGQWEVVLHIAAAPASDRVTIELRL